LRFDTISILIVLSIDRFVFVIKSGQTTEISVKKAFGIKIKTPVYFPFKTNKNQISVGNR
jgi:hypothetical protein